MQIQFEPSNKQSVTIKILSLTLICFFSISVFAQKSVSQIGTITVISEPDAVVWLDGVRRGKTDADGKLIIKAVSAGKHLLRVRDDVF